MSTAERSTETTTVQESFVFKLLVGFDTALHRTYLVKSSDRKRSAVQVYAPANGAGILNQRSAQIRNFTLGEIEHGN